MIRSKQDIKTIIEAIIIIILSATESNKALSSFCDLDFVVVESFIYVLFRERYLCKMNICIPK